MHPLELVRDELIGQTFRLLGFAEFEYRWIREELYGLRDYILAELAKDFEGLNAKRRGTLKRLFSRVENRIGRTYRDIARRESVNQSAVAHQVARGTADYYRKHTGLSGFTVPTRERLQVLRRDHLVRGTPIDEIWTRAGDALRKRFEDRIRLAFLEPTTLGALSNAVMDIMGRDGAKGEKSITRVQARIMARSGLSAVAGMARTRFYYENRSILGEQVWLSVLDLRTTDTCVHRNMKRYSIDPIPKSIGHSLEWGAGPGAYHPGCRAISIAMPNNRTLKGAKKAALGGPVDLDTTTEAWLKRQSASDQRAFLGAKRYRLWVNGMLDGETLAKHAKVLDKIENI